MLFVTRTMSPTAATCRDNDRDDGLASTRRPSPSLTCARTMTVVVRRATTSGGHVTGDTARVSVLRPLTSLRHCSRRPVASSGECRTHVVLARRPPAILRMHVACSDRVYIDTQPLPGLYTTHAACRTQPSLAALTYRTGC